MNFSSPPGGFDIVSKQYAIKTDSIGPSIEEWKDLDGSQFVLTPVKGGSAATYYVYLKLIDSENVVFQTHKKIEIDYNQKRY